MYLEKSTARSGATLLVVDDDADIRDLLAGSLEDRGYRTMTARNVVEMDRLLATYPVDVVILDVMMPGEDGLSACRRLAANAGPPVILLSGLNDEADRILGLEIGAAHYLPKPCSAREVLANVRTILRQQEPPARHRRVLTFRGWKIDLQANELLDPGGLPIVLTKGEFAVLRVFLDRPRQVLSRNEILQAARGPDTDSGNRAINIQISRLRRKLRAPNNSLLRTIRNEGYMLVSDVTAATHDPASTRIS
ncbi:MAG: response regulator [Candidatus Sphingomonas phytovorans]|nr:response regulator [Sphingomonas sp.]WEK01165.1 MAG: response regulator [Sphingomonas sp.]